MYGTPIRLRLAPALLAAATVFAVGVPGTAAVGAPAAAPAAVADEPSPGAACSVTYTVVTQWVDGFMANLTVTNIGPVPVRWRITWRFLPGQEVVQIWGGTASRVGDEVSVVGSYPWNGVLLPGQSTTIGFVGRYQNVNPIPTVECTAV